MDKRECNVLDLYSAGVELLQMLKEAYGRRPPGLRLEYSLGGLAAIGAWALELCDVDEHLMKYVALSTLRTSVHICPVVSRADSHGVAKEDIEARIELDKRWMRGDAVQTGPAGTYYSFTRRHPDKPISTPTFRVGMDMMDVIIHTNPTARGAHFLEASNGSGVSFLSGPFLLFTAVDMIRRLHLEQIESDDDVPAQDAVVQSFSILLIWRLQAAHGVASMHLTHQDWRTFIQNLPSESDYKGLKRYIFEHTLRANSLVERTAAWIRGMFTNGRNVPACPPEQALLDENHEGLSWAEKFFDTDPSGQGTMPAIQMRSLGKPSSPYEPADRHLAREF